MTPQPSTTYALPVLQSRDLRVVSGVNEGDTLSFADELMLDDVYALRPRPARGTMLVALGPRLHSLRVQPGSALGTAGNAVHLDSCLTFMDERGSIIEMLVLVEVEDDMAIDVYCMPLSAPAHDAPYRLVGIDRHAATRRFSQVACVSFAKGTRITTATGHQCPIDELRVGDMILTRDGGAQPLRWIGHATMRAAGDFAPVRIAAGTLNNPTDLLISPDHRILIYQREDRLGIGQSEVLIKARHLINGTTVVQQSGGYIDYYQLLFDEHHLIYAEGVASESLLMSARTRPAVPADIAAQILGDADAQPSRTPQHYEVASSLLSKPDTVALLKAASGD